MCAICKPSDNFYFCRFSFVIEDIEVSDYSNDEDDERPTEDIVCDSASKSIKNKLPHQI